MLAGGMSLIPVMKLRFATPRALVDINRIAGLDTLAEQDGELRIGALVRHKACERSELLKGKYGALGDAAPQISDPIVRNLGTVARLARACRSAGRLGIGDARGRAPRSSREARTASARFRSTSCSWARSRPRSSRTRSSPRCASPTRARARAAPTSSSSARSATSRPPASPFTSRCRTARSGRRGSRSPASARRTCARDEAEQALAGAALDDEAIAEAARLAAEAARRRTDVRGTEEYKRNVDPRVHRARPAQGGGGGGMNCPSCGQDLPAEPASTLSRRAPASSTARTAARA